MINLGGYAFDDHKACIICRHIADGYPVLAYAHDEDGDQHFTCGGQRHGEDDWQVVELTHLLEQVRSMPDLPVVHAGFCAERINTQAPWSVEPLNS